MGLPWFPVGVKTVRESRKLGLRRYRLALGTAPRGEAETIEFEASGAEAALAMTQRFCGGREVELFEDGESLGRVRNDKNWGFWVFRGKGAR